jgi:hypothetical protein
MVVVVVVVVVVIGPASPGRASAVDAKSGMKHLRGCIPPTFYFWM